MKTPEIIIQEERGSPLLFLLLKAENSEWGETKGSLAQETTSYFNKEGIDEKALYNLALTYQKPKRIGKVLEMIVKHEPDFSFKFI